MTKLKERECRQTSNIIFNDISDLLSYWKTGIQPRILPKIDLKQPLLQSS